MTAGWLGLMSSSVVAWIFVLARSGPRRSLFRVAIEALAVHVVVSTLVGVALLSGAIFRFSGAQALAATVPFAALLRSSWPPWSALKGATVITRRELVVLLALVLVAPVALPRMELLSMDSDAGVYTNQALHHLHEGCLVGTIPVRDRLGGDLLDTFDRDNVYSEKQYRPGTYRTLPDPNQFHFQFFPGWPMLMALWAGLFGLSGMFYAGLFVFSMGVLFFGFLLQDAGLRGAGFTLPVALLASSPLLLYFSKYTTTEAFLLFLFLFVIYFLEQGGVCHTTLAVAGFLAIVVTHVSTFAYAPLLLLVVLEAYRSASPRLAGFSAGAFGALLVGLPLGLLFSPAYVHDIYAATFRPLALEDPARAGTILMAAFYVAGLTGSLAAWRRGLAASASEASSAGWLSRGEGVVRMTVRVVLPLVVAGIVCRAWQLGWTDRFASADVAGAWAARKQYAGTGWAALTHLNVVSMILATSLVGLPTVAAWVYRRGDTACAARGRCFLVSCLLFGLLIFAVIRVDVPYNYYASRYFIPVFVPATMLLFGHALERLRAHRGWVVVLALVGVGFNLYFDRALYRFPPHTDEVRFVDGVATRVGDRRILFGRNLWRSNMMIRRLLAGPLFHVYGISLINVVGREGAPADATISEYAGQLRIRDAAVLSKAPPADGRPFETVSLVQRELARARFYPHSSVERTHRFYLYDARFD